MIPSGWIALNKPGGEPLRLRVSEIIFYGVDGAYVKVTMPIVGTFRVAESIETIDSFILAAHRKP